MPTCICFDDYTGDARSGCYEIPKQDPIPLNPCAPSPCGLNSQCRQSVNNHAVCSCLPDMRGSPPNCVPECTTNSHCELSRSCINTLCVDPCAANPCARDNSRCTVQNHNAICKCLSGFEGDPFFECRPIKCKVFLFFY
jgi:hypothetical protein